MKRTTLTTFALGCLAALLLAENANADTYNFYFPKRGGAPEVERADDEDLGRRSAILSQDDDEDDEPVLVEEVPIVVPQRRVMKRKVVHAQLQLQLPIPFILHGSLVPAPVLMDDEDPYDPMVGTNTTPGHTLAPRTRVVRRTVVLDN